MIIKSYTYWQHPDKPQMWKIDNCLFHPSLNLIVGKNASGKTRIINTITNLALLLSGRRKQLSSSGNWEIIFQSGIDTEVKYLLCIEENKVIQEKFTQNNETLLERETSGKGKIWAEEEKKKIAFQIDPSEIATLKKYDSLQHPFLNDLSEWANRLRIYHFGTDFSKNTLTIFVERPVSGDLLTTASDQNLDQIVALYSDGVKKFGDEFLGQIKKDMEFIGYNLETITVEPVKQVQPRNLLPTFPHGIHIKESDLDFKVPQYEISQGMFRALALLINLNYLQFCSSPQNCILIDDIGEGLDFDRSSKLIKLILEKFVSSTTNSKNIQIIMTTNDRFAMNSIPLDYWLLIQRTSSLVKIFSKNNTPEIFKEFEFTGLNNFDFLASEYFKG